MAITITSPATANISDNTTSVSVSWSGASYGANWRVTYQLLVNGTVVNTYTITPGSSSGSGNLFVAANVQAIYTNAAGSSRTGAISIRVTNQLQISPYTSTSDTVTGTLTINYRIKDLVLTEPVSPSRLWNMDNTTGNTLTSSWTRTNSAFAARLKGYVNGTLVFNRYGYTTSSNTDVDAYGYHAAIESAMSGVSPADFRLDIITQFNDGTGDWEDLSYTASETTGNYTRRTANDSITKTFYTLSTISVSTLNLTNSTTTVPFTLTEYGSYTHSVSLYLRVSGVDTLIRTETGVTASGNFTIGTTERGLILDRMLPSTSESIWASVTTEAYGTTNSSTATITIDSSMISGLSVTQNPFSITSEDGTTQDIDVSGIYYYVSGNSSLLLQVKVNGVVVKSTYGYPTGPTYQFTNIDFNAVKTDIYNNASGHSLTGAVTVTVTSYRTSAAASTAVTTSAGNLTLAYRINTLVLTEPSTTGGREWYLDNTTGNTLTSSWSRVNTCFGGRLKGYVNGTLVLNIRGFTTSSNTDIDAAGYHSAIASAMASVSPASFKLEIITQFNDGTAEWQDLSYTASEGTTQRTTSNSIIYYLYDLATIAISNVTLYNTTTTIPYTLTEVKQLTYEVNFYTRVGGTDTLIRTESGVTASGNFTLGYAERSAILAAFLPSTSGTIVATVTTESYGTTEGTTKTLTIDSSMLGAQVILSIDSGLVMRVLGYVVESGTDINLSSTGILTVPQIIEGATDDINSSKYVTVKEFIEGEV